MLSINDLSEAGIFINARLHLLGNVVSALSNRPSSSFSQTDKKSKKQNHIPYRERYETDCLWREQLNESLNTLRYAIWAKKIENVSQKTTKVISTPSIILMGMPMMSTMMSRVGSNKNKLQPLGGGDVSAPERLYGEHVVQDGDQSNRHVGHAHRSCSKRNQETDGDDECGRAGHRQMGSMIYL
ncbi:Kinesin-like protein kif21b [Puccinia graminis f. sp. tritici]|uniref:Kinesin-like protein kif21b n=1 Tax=Puccinia graminis f. sp. tritici TaxID=56615 RepID=A0A5B0S8D1_PUCGR|nr:Kinesin-like protein kif21b [Puccinia graminis f. sp. tritici]KAA1134062.1 Kinesin-like protein kif21b [Puccinia graminis f. sp. tritici]